MRAGFHFCQDNTSLFPPPLLPWFAVCVMALGFISEFVPR